MRVPITATRGFWDEANERTQFRDQLQPHHTQIIENDDMDIGFLSKLQSVAPAERVPFAMVWQPVASWIPGRSALAYSFNLWQSLGSVEVWRVLSGRPTALRQQTRAVE